MISSSLWGVNDQRLHLIDALIADNHVARTRHLSECPAFGGKPTALIEHHHTVPCRRTLQLASY